MASTLIIVHSTAAGYGVTATGGDSIDYGLTIDASAVTTTAPAPEPPQSRHLRLVR